LEEGLITYALWDSGSTLITRFSTTWTVPQLPTTSSGQVIYLFNGLEYIGCSSAAILQPVLQYAFAAGAGGNYWSIRSWYVTPSGPVMRSPSQIQVQPGQVLVGLITQTAVRVKTAVSGPWYSYTCEFQGIPDTTLQVQNVQRLHLACETLEAYSMTRASDYPASPNTAFTDIDILTGSSHPALTWKAVNRVADTGQHAVIVSNSDPGGEVDLWYSGRPRGGITVT
jgi:hypothetical protein